MSEHLAKEAKKKIPPSLIGERQKKRKCDKETDWSKVMKSVSKRAAPNSPAGVREGADLKDYDDDEDEDEEEEDDTENENNDEEKGPGKKDDENNDGGNDNNGMLMCLLFAGCRPVIFWSEPPPQKVKLLH